ncbi:formimidoylglutamase [Clostridium tetani]|uniref:Formimidoylglutamase n=1 Tax=Clostridium tetani TaxID=1513 RepID=A0A4Q0VED2_CLOTA|nr:formimidoylglutamase [Clostridium tetani]RXI49878.1 formimidoylglutamase [Clostridium tetani]BDR67584.1 formimidoylglutamase [Clostridium tetani]BDR72974.1 formimidoylglutamase [Clostridium tetani]BDR81517.1 formimidoylglutamase [Clostridium tetani]BDR89898.1 formimidoylglutamase [Clostridium tetani]
MLGINYKPCNEDFWQGRTDSEENFLAFRWHQWIKPINLNKDDLSPFTGKLGFAFIGFCCDEGIRRNKGRTGAAKGPETIREEMANLPCCFTDEVKLFDAGNILVENISLEEGQDLLSKAINKILSLNLFPIVLGGGHEVAFGNYLGVLSHLKTINSKPNIGIINFDAHLDIRPYTEGMGSSGTMFRQISDICKKEDLNYSYLCMGVQKHSNTLELFKTADKLGANYVFAKNITYGDNWIVFESLDDFMKTQDYIYVTVCSDVFSSAFAPGVSASQSLGLDPEIVVRFIKYILRSNKVISFDIAEVSPRFDQGHVTANLAAVVIFSVIDTIAKIYGLGL